MPQKQTFGAERFLHRISLRGTIQVADKGYPFNIPAVMALRQGLEFATPITFLVGENGSGKSTLLEALAIGCGFNAEGGSRNLSFDTRQSHSQLHERLEISRSIRRPRTGFFLRAESFYNVISAIEALDAESASGPPIMSSYTDAISLHARSHGESFWDLLMNRFSANGLYLLDEPESALSPHRQLAALRRFHNLVAEGSQFVIATHSPLLLAYPQASIQLLDERGITLTAYEDVPHVRLYRGALANPSLLMHELLDEDESE